MDAEPTLKRVVDHIEHLLEVAGPDHVGLGLDFYRNPGLGELEDGLAHVATQVCRSG